MLLNKFLLFCIISIFSFNLINSMNDKPLCESKECCNMESPNQCYCSELCGPREKHDGDNPVWVNGMCFCQQWDVDNYYKNECDKKDKETSLEFEE
ncbi:hypothetical protein M1446_01040 [Candidatus Dependentiae bacterium]|nr:hypothetical protein [Candidatus Dependentiae bacterium]